MDRRTVLRLAGVGVAVLAGCTGSDDERGSPPNQPAPENDIYTPTPEPFVEELGSNISAVTYSESDDSRLQATFPVRNADDRSRGAAVVAIVEIDGQRYTTKQLISVPAGETHNKTVTFDVPYDAIDDGAVVMRRIWLYKPSRAPTVG